MNMTPEIITALAALSAVTIGPFLSIYVVKKQINSTALSANRQEWINKLRIILSELVTIVRHVSPAYAAGSITNKDAISKHGELTEKIELVKLLLNPNEADHEKLIKLISSASTNMQDAINCKIGKADVMDKISERITTQSQVILKREWERVKSGK